MDVLNLTPETIGILIAALIIAAILIIAFIKANLHVCPPNELLIFSGKKRKLKDGTIVGYRAMKGGRGLKIPIIESVSRMPLNTFTVDMELIGALTNGIIPINIEAMANVKVAGNEADGINNALERFLGRNMGEISQVARETIEGSLRGVLATLSPEEANEKRLEFAEKVSEQASADLEKLGLVLDTFKIKNISDPEGYMDNIGRKKNAEVKRDAIIAEAKTEAESRIATAESKRKGSIAEYESELAVIEAENSYKIKKAKLAEEVNKAESKALVAGDIAKIAEEEKLEDARVKMNKKKYEAETVVPAQADKEAKVLYAKGKAARIVEDGKAMAESVKLLREEWEKDETRELYLIQQLPMILDKVTSVVKENLRVDKLTILDNGDGNGLPTLVKGLTGSTAAFFEGIKSATGLDIPEILQSKKGGGKSD
jgi:flotillin